MVKSVISVSVTSSEVIVKDSRHEVLRSTDVIRPVLLLKKDELSENFKPAVLPTEKKFLTSVWLPWLINYHASL